MVEVTIYGGIEFSTKKHITVTLHGQHVHGEGWGSNVLPLASGLINSDDIGHLCIVPYSTLLDATKKSVLRLYEEKVSPIEFQRIDFGPLVVTSFATPDVIYTAVDRSIFHIKVRYDGEAVMEPLLFLGNGVSALGVMTTPNLVYVEGEHEVYVQETIEALSTVTPKKVTTDYARTGKILQLQCGVSHCVILDEHGQLYTLGQNTRGQLGIGMDTKQTVDCMRHVEILGWTQVIKVGVGGWHSLALTHTGDIYGWGWNDCGQVGVGDTAGIIQYPQLLEVDSLGLPFDRQVIDIACGSKHSAALCVDNEVFVWGCNTFHQLSIRPNLAADFSRPYRIECRKKCIRLQCGHMSTLLYH